MSKQEWFVDYSQASEVVNQYHDAKVEGMCVIPTEGGESTTSDGYYTRLGAVVNVRGLRYAFSKSAFLAFAVTNLELRNAATPV